MAGYHVVDFFNQIEAFKRNMRTAFFIISHAEVITLEHLTVELVFTEKGIQFGAVRNAVIWHVPPVQHVERSRQIVNLGVPV